MEDWINMVLEKIIDDGDYEAPDPHMKLDLAQWFGLMYYAQGQTIKLPQERLDLISNWLTQVQALMQAAMPPALPAPGAPGQAGPPGAGAPLAQPTAPPTSDLIPNVPMPQGVQ